ncbi:MAG: hypothetical protein ABI950_12495 [Solirubrobacteraceae bacterium]
MSASGATVLVAGVGDLGGRVLTALARSRHVDRLIAAGRDDERTRGHAGQAALIAHLAGGPRRVEPARVDLADAEATAAALARTEPDVIVIGATEYTWWRDSRTELPYAAWLPLQLPLVRALMQARNAAVPGAHVVCLPFPDAVGPILAGVGLAPTVGAGNVAEVAAKLAVLAGDEADVRLVMHHASERVALSAFASLAGAGEEPGEPPWAARVQVSSGELDPERVGALFHAAYSLRAGRETHELTAASTAAIVEGLLADEPVRAHAPAPGGRAGGYPVLLSRSGAALDLPPGLDEREALTINARAARWDGIEAIEDDGTVRLTEHAATALSRAVGSHVRDIAPDDHDVLAAALRERAI